MAVDYAGIEAVAEDVREGVTNNRTLGFQDSSGRVKKT